MEPRKSVYAAVRSAKSGLLAAALVTSIMGCGDLSTITGGQSNTGKPANAVPTLTFTKPNANMTAFVGQIIPITWFASDTDDSILVKVYYDQDGLKASGDEVLLTQVSKVAKDYSASTFSWNTASLSPGTYHVLAIVDDGVNPAVTVYDSSVITIQQSVPAVAVIEPFGGMSVEPAQNLVIKWTQDAPLSSSTLTLFYDTDQDYANGVAGTINTTTQPASSTGGEFTWNVPAVRAGRYYLGATLDDGTHPLAVAYAQGYLDIAGPRVEVLNPAANVQLHGGGTLSIRYTVTAPRATGTLRLFYDSDGVPGSGDEIWLVTLPLTNGTKSYTWTTGALNLGTYHVGAEINDGVNDPIVGYAAGLVQEMGPALTVVAPAAPVTWHVGGKVDVTFQAFAASAQAEIFYDKDGLADTGDEITLTSQPVNNGITTTWTWQQNTQLLDGTYHVGVKIIDGANAPMIAYAAGAIQEVGPGLQFTVPSGAVTLGAGDTQPITFNYQSFCVKPNVRIFYDLNTTYDPATDDAQTIAPTPILENATPTGSATDTVNWLVPLLQANTYHIGAVITAGPDTVVVYATPNVVVAGPKLTLTDPAAPTPPAILEMMIGDPVTIKWSNTIPGTNPKMTLFYNSTQSDTGADYHTIFVDQNPNDPTMNKTYVWPIAANVGSQVHIGATVTDDLGQTAVSYAPGVITIPDPKQFDRDLAVMTNYPDGSANDPTKPILVFQGESAGGSLGQTIAGGPFYFSGGEVNSDLNGDGIPDFIIVATTGKPLILQSQTARYGEGYLLYGWAGGRRAQQKVRLTQVTSAAWPGAIFPGVKYTTSSLGITSVAVLPNLDGDTNATTNQPLLDLVFGLPYVHGVAHEDQDYDPIDQDGWIRPAVPPGVDPTPYNNLTALNPQSPDNTTPDAYTTVAGGTPFQTGLVIFVASTTAGNGFDGKVMPLDDVGQTSSNPLPRAVPGNGMRVYPETLFSAHGSSDLNDPSLFGQSVAVGDLDSDRRPDWLISAPNGNGGAGFVEVIFSSKYSGGFDRGSMPSYPGTTLNAISYPYVRTQPPTGITMDRDWDIPWRASRQFINGEGTGNLDKPITIGDFNGDSRDDVACVAPNFNAGAGAAYIIFTGPTFGNFDVSRIDNTASSLPGLKIVGAAGQKLGSSHARFGDLNGDGYDDWAIGASGYTYAGRAGCGAVAIIFGGATINGSRTLADVGDPATGKLVPGLIIVGGHAGDAVGTYTVTAGDVDGDGNLDILVSAPGYTYPADPTATPPRPAARAACGAVYLIYGGPALQPSNNVIDLAEVGRTVAGKVYIGPIAGNGIGPVSAAGDIDQDGMADFLIGNPLASPRGVTGAGEAYLIYGSGRRVQ